jgi:hypothetical protein
MSHEIEADFQTESKNENRQCQLCANYQEGYCQELQMEVPPIGYCDFFSSKD